MKREQTTVFYFRLNVVLVADLGTKDLLRCTVQRSYPLLQFPTGRGRREGLTENSGQENDGQTL